MCTYNILLSYRFTPSTALRLPLAYPTFEINFNRFHSPIFKYEYRIHPPYSLSFTPSLCFPHHSGAHSQRRPILLSCLFFFLTVYYSPRQFSLGTSGLYISCFSQVIPPVTYSLPSCSPNSQWLTVQYVTLTYTYITVS